MTRLTEEQLTEQTEQFDAEAVWAYVQIDQSVAYKLPITVPALRIGHFAITEIEYDDHYDFMGLDWAKVTHLPSGVSLSGWQHLEKAKAFCLDLSKLGEAADTLCPKEMQRLFAPIAIAHGLIEDDRINPACEVVAFVRVNQ